MQKIEFNNIVKTQFEKSARWAKFLAFFGFFIIGLYIISWLIMLANSPNLDYLVILIINSILLVPCIYLYYFSKKVTTAISNNDIKEFESGIKNLANFFHFLGILIMIAVTLNLLQILMMY